MTGELYPAQVLRRRALGWAIKLRVNPRAVRIQKMRTKWGSCTSSGTVTFADDLLDQDTAFQDYVMVHELLHLRYPTHGRLFHAVLAVHVPHWRRYEQRAPRDRDSSERFVVEEKRNPQAGGREAHRKRGGDH